MVLFFKYIKKYKKLLVIALVLATINQVFSLLDPQIVRILIDNYATNFEDLSRAEFFKGAGLLLIAFVGVAFISRTAKNFQDYFVSAITYNVGTDMYAEGVNHTFLLPFGVFEEHKSGEVLEKLKKARLDTQAVIGSSINILFLSLVGITFVIIYSFTVHWSIAVTFLAAIPSLGLFTFMVSKRIKVAQKEIVKESAELAGATTETLRNVELVKSLGLENQEIKRLNDVNKKILNLELKKIRYIRLLSFLQGTIVNGVRVVLMFLMLFLIFNGNITLGEFLSLFFYSFFIFAPLGELATVIAQYQEAKASNEKLEELLNIKPLDKPKNIKEINKINSVELNNVSFDYNEGEGSALTNVSFKIDKGARIAFVGPSGSGKTTITKLILGLYQSKKGDILFNNINSKKLDYDFIRKRIGLVSQDTQLFAGTIRENLLFVNPQASDARCIECLKMASVDHILKRLGNGLNTKIGEGGIKLSGGEKQRLAIARALLRDPDLIIFDEATSALDSLTERDITDTIRKVSKERPNLMVITIAHRLSTIAHSDVIYVLKMGKLIESGTHKELLSKKGLYEALWKEQSVEN